MVPPSHMDRFKKDEYFEILDETIRTNPYRKAATAMASVMSKHGIVSDASNTLGKTSLGLSEKTCALTRALRLAQNCNYKLNLTRDELQALCCDLVEGKQSNMGDTTSEETAENPQTKGNSPADRAVMTGHLLTLIGEAQTIAKRIYETAVGLHVAEDFLRHPEDIKLLDFSSNGRIQIPNYNFNHASQLCLEWLHSTATKWLRGFKEDGGEDNAQFISVFDNFTKAVKDYMESVCLANQVFRVLLYPNIHGKQTLQEYVLSLGHVLKNDIMMEAQSLRRAFDNIQYSFERLGWAASIAWMKYSGQNITVETLNENGIQVDYSIFQHKFYEGPFKLRDRGKEADSDTNQTRTANSATVVGSNSGVKGKKAKSTKNKPPHTATGHREKSIKKVASPFTGDLQECSSTNTFASTSVSRSASETSKLKKAPRKKIRSQKTAQNLLGSKISSAPSSAVALDLSNSSAGSNILKIMKNDTERPGSNAHMITAGNFRNQVASLTPAPRIPLAWRKQFGAVFGPHLLPPSAKGPKKVKKKPSMVKESKSNSVTTQKQSDKAV